MTALGNAIISNSAPSPNLLTKEIQDLFTRKNFQNLVAYFAAQNQMLNFSFFEIVVSSATPSTQTLNHGLGFIPKDVIVSQITGAGTFNFLFGQFDKTNIYYTATGACRVRFFVGTYFNDTSTVVANASDTMSVVSTG